MKICNSCKQIKPLDQFDLKRGKPQARCKQCRAEYMAKHYQGNKEVEVAKRRVWYNKNREKVLAKMKLDRAERAPQINLARRLKKYKLTEAEYFAMLEAQNHKCANPKCESGFDELDIDHCHKSGKVRGILCGHCNTALGLIKESIPALHGLIEYLINARSKG